MIYKIIKKQKERSEHNEAIKFDFSVTNIVAVLGFIFKKKLGPLRKEFTSIII